MLYPTRGKILVQVIEDEKLTKSGLILSFKNEIPHRGYIISFGLPYVDKKGKEKSWGIHRRDIVHFKRIWDQRKVKNYIIKRDQIYAVECEGKVYGFSDYVIVKKEKEVNSQLIYVPSHFEIEVEKQTAQAKIISVGIEDKLGLKKDDIILYYRTEGLLVKIPNCEDMWSLNPRSIIGKVNV